MILPLYLLPYASYTIYHTLFFYHPLHMSQCTRTDPVSTNNKSVGRFRPGSGSRYNMFTVGFVLFSVHGHQK